MNLRKDKWENVIVGNFTNITTGKINSNNADNKGIYPFFTCSKDVLWINHFAYDCEALLLAGNNATADYDVKYYKGKFNAYQRTYIITIPNEHIEYAYLKILLEKNLLLLKENSIGTQTKYLKIGMIQNIQIPLPPLDEQQRIVELFQSIEQSIVQAEKQEKNLHWLLHGLINDYTNPKSKYRKSTLQKIRFGNIAQNISERIEPKDAIGQIFVGLEHLDPRDIAIRRFGKPDDLIGTKLKVYEGDIIFSKRNAYLRKAAVANFTGICSAHAMVIRAIPEKIYKDFLPYFIHSDSFMARAKEISEGSISPTIKWKNLENQEFLIPSIEEQETISDLFIQIDQTCNLIREQKETLKKLKQKLLNEILG